MRIAQIAPLHEAVPPRDVTLVAGGDAGTSAE